VTTIGEHHRVATLRTLPRTGESHARCNACPARHKTENWVCGLATPRFVAYVFKALCSNDFIVENLIRPLNVNQELREDEQLILRWGCGRLMGGRTCGLDMTCNSFSFDMCIV